MARTMESDTPALSVVAPLPAKNRLSLLGGFALTSRGKPVTLSANGQRLVAFLALNDRPASRVRVAATLWPDSTETRAGANLRSAVWRLRRLTPWLLGAGDGLDLSAEVEVDVSEARAVAERLSNPTEADEEAQPAPFLLDLLPDWYEDWVIMERERYRQTRLHALEALGDLLIAGGRYARAVDAGMAAVAGEPLRESAQRILIRAHLAEGNLSEAVRQYRSYGRLLQEELGVEPSPELQRLVGIPGS